MRVFISVDMEGVAGIVHENQTNPDDPRCAAEYARSCHLMTAEANAAIEGARDAGATRILVNDSHWHMRNILAEELDPAAELSSGSPKPLSMMEGVNGGFDVALCIGYHPRAGTQHAVIDHTYNAAVIANVRLNGRAVGELGINAGLAGHYGVPVAAVSGDGALAREARDLLGDGVETIVVKESLGRQAARSLSPAEARQRLRAGVANALRRTHKPFVLAAPITLTVDFFRTHHADMAELVPGSIRPGPCAVLFTHDNYREVFRAWRAMYNLAGVT